jgi:hypothetical protein
LIYRIGLFLRCLVEASPYGKIRVLLETVALRGRATTQPSRIKPSVQPRRWDPDSSPFEFCDSLASGGQRNRKKQAGISMVGKNNNMRNLELQWKLSKFLSKCQAIRTLDTGAVEDNPCYCWNG